MKKQKPLQNSISLDWFSFTLFRDWKYGESIMKLLNKNGFDMRRQAKGRQGYNYWFKSFQFPGFDLLYIDERDDMGVHLDFSGSQLGILPIVIDLVCDGWTSYAYTRDSAGITHANHTVLTADAQIKAITKLLGMDGLSITRLDIAFDSVQPELFYMRVEDIADYVLHRDFVSAWIKYSYIQSSSGNTLYFGKRKSERYLRIYDKAAEQGIPSDP